MRKHKRQLMLSIGTASPN